MKGNEARVIFFLHAVDQFRKGSVQKKETNSWINSWMSHALEDDKEKTEEIGEKRQKIDGKDEDTTLLLTTKPYYLALTRSSCEVSLRDAYGWWSIRKLWTLSTYIQKARKMRKLCSGEVWAQLITYDNT